MEVSGLQSLYVRPRLLPGSLLSCLLFRFQQGCADVSIPLTGVN